MWTLSHYFVIALYTASALIGFLPVALFFKQPYVLFAFAAITVVILIFQLLLHPPLSPAGIYP